MSLVLLFHYMWFSSNSKAWSHKESLSNRKRNANMDWSLSPKEIPQILLGLIESSQQRVVITHQPEQSSPPLALCRLMLISSPSYVSRADKYIPIGISTDLLRSALVKEFKKAAAMNSTVFPFFFSLFLFDFVLSLPSSSSQSLSIKTYVVMK